MIEQPLQQRNKQKIILAVNPSHATEIEDDFWQQVAEESKKLGWLLVEIAARKIPSTPNAKTMIMPARLKDVGKKMRSLPVEGLAFNLQWFTELDFHTLEDWEHRRWEFRLYDHAISSGLLRLAHLVDTVITELNPAIVLTTNKIDHPCYLFRKAAKHYGNYVGLIERSPIDTIWYEKDGIFTESNIWNAYDPNNLAERTDIYSLGQTITEGIISNPSGFRKKEVSIQIPQISVNSSDTPIFFLPMDNVLWTGWEQEDHPQRAIDYPIFNTPEEALQSLQDIIQTLGGKLIVKKHPSCKYIRDEIMPDGVDLVEGDISYIIEKSDVVICFNTKVAFTALALGKPVVVLAHNPVAVSEATYHCVKTADLKETLLRALNEGFTSEHKKSFTAFCGWLAKEYFYGVDKKLDLHSKSVKELVYEFTELFEKVYVDEIKQDALKNIKLIIDGNTKGKYNLDNYIETTSFGTTFALKRLPKETDLINVGIDVWRLAHYYARKLPLNGINNYLMNLVRNLEESNEIIIKPLIFPDPLTENVKSYNTFQNLSKKPQSWLIDNLNVEYPFSNSKSIDVYHSPVNPLPSTVITREVPRILTVHDCIHIVKPEFWPHQRTPHIAHALSSVCLAKDYIVCDSDATRHDVLSLLPINPNRVRTVYLAVNEEYHNPELHLFKDRITKFGLRSDGYVMGLFQNDPRKNITSLIQAYKKAKDSFTADNIKLLLICSNSKTLLDLENTIDKYGLSKEDVVIVTDVDDKELSIFYHHAMVFVYPSLYEGFGLPPLEALTAACPVIVSNLSSLPEVVGDAGLYINPYDAEAIVETIVEVINNEALRQSLREKAKHQAKKFSWKNTTQQMVQIYLEVYEESLRKNYRRNFWRAIENK